MVEEGENQNGEEEEEEEEEEQEQVEVYMPEVLVAVEWHAGLYDSLSLVVGTSWPGLLTTQQEQLQVKQ